ncbi:unnamed protein product [Umbelopsis ramanniana]
MEAVPTATGSAKRPIMNTMILAGLTGQPTNEEDGWLRMSIFNIDQHFAIGQTHQFWRTQRGKNKSAGKLRVQYEWYRTAALPSTDSEVIGVKLDSRKSQ